MREDAPTPNAIPTKRRQLHAAPDLWLREWMNRETMKPSVRRLLTEEIERRKRVAPPVIAILKAREGLTPEQKRAVRDMATHGESRPVLLGRHPSRPGYMEFQEEVKKADLVIAAPKENYKPEQPPEGSVWAAVQYARHRKLPVKVIMPNGEELQHEE